MGITWFEAEAYARWLTRRVGRFPEDSRTLVIRLPHEDEWQAGIGGRGEFPWGDDFDHRNLNCAESWVGREFKDDMEWIDWLNSDTESWREASTTAVTSYAQGISASGIWDGSGNVFEWMINPYQPNGDRMALRGGSWSGSQRSARVSYRYDFHPVNFYSNIGFRVVLAPVW